MTRRTRVATSLAGLVLAAVVLGRPRPATVVVDTGPVGQRVVMRASVVSAPAEGTGSGLLADAGMIDAARLSVGRPVAVTAPGGGEPIAHGRIDVISERAVRVTWTDPAPAMTSGTTVEAIVELAPHPAAARVPRAAVAVREGRTVVDRPGFASLWRREAEVEVLAADDTFAAVSGVAPGERVIVPTAHVDSTRTAR